MKNISFSILSLIFSLTLFITGCENNNNTINNDSAGVALLLIADNAMGCFVQRDCSACVPSTFVKSPLVSREDCSGVWIMPPVVDPVCFTGISTTVKVGDTTTITYKTPCD